VASTTLKQPIGRPQKQLHAILIVEKQVKQEDNKEDELSKSIIFFKNEVFTPTSLCHTFGLPFLLL